MVAVPERRPTAAATASAAMWVPGLHPMAVHGATERGAVLTVRGHHYQFVYRYESWVQFRIAPGAAPGRPGAAGRAC